MKTAQQEALERRRDALLAQVRSWPNLMRGAVYEKSRKCGRASCSCAKGGERHETRQFTVTVDRRTHTRYVRSSEWAEVSRLTANYRRLLTVIDELTLVNLELMHAEQAPARRRRS